MEQIKYQASNNFDLLREFVKSNFKLRYKDSVLGFVWVILKPLLTFGVLYVVFSSFRAKDIENYPMYLLIGIVFYNLFNEGMLFGINSLLEKAHIILKVNFARHIAVISSVLMALINTFINSVILVIFSIFSPIQPTWESGLFAIFILLTVFIMVLGISLFASIIAIRLKDLKNTFEILLQLGFYAIPIFYPLSLIPERFRPFVEYNPLTMLLESIRGALIQGQIVGLNRVMIIFGVSVITTIAGFAFFKGRVKKVAEFI